MKATTKRMIAMCLVLLLTLTSLSAAAPLAAAAGAELASYDVQTFYQSNAPDDSKQGSVVSIDQAAGFGSLDIITARLDTRASTRCFTVKISGR